MTAPGNTSTIRLPKLSSGWWEITPSPMPASACQRGRKASVDMPSRGGQFGEFRCIGVFPNSDGKWVAFTPSTRQIWDRFMKALGREDFLDEASYPPRLERARGAGRKRCIPLSGSGLPAALVMKSSA